MSTEHNYKFSKAPDLYYKVYTTTHKRCVVPDCSLVGSYSRTSSFPYKNPALCKKWIEAINSPEVFKGKTLENLSKMRICLKHFEDHFIEKNIYPGSNKAALLKGAYPTLQLKPLSIHEILKIREKKLREDSDAQTTTDIINEHIELYSSKINEEQNEKSNEIPTLPEQNTLVIKHPLVGKKHTEIQIEHTVVQKEHTEVQKEYTLTHEHMVVQTEHTVVQNVPTVIKNEPSVLEKDHALVQKKHTMVREVKDIPDIPKNSAANIFSNFLLNEDDNTRFSDALSIDESNKNENMLEKDENIKVEVASVSSDDEEYILENLNPENVHNYAVKMNVIEDPKKPDIVNELEIVQEKSKEVEAKPKAEFFEILNDKIDPDKTVMIDYVDGKIIWNLVDKTDVNIPKSVIEVPVEIVRCCICVDETEGLTSFFQLDDDETFYNKIIATFPDMQLNFDDLSSVICVTCLENVRTAYKFRNTLVQGQKKLKEINLNSRKSKFKYKPASKHNKNLVQKQINLKDTLVSEIENISNLNNTGSPKKQKMPLNLKRCDKNKVVQDILSKLDGIIITKTKTNPVIETQKPKTGSYVYRCNFCSLQFNNLMPLYHHKIFNHGQDQYRHRILNKMKSQKMTLMEKIEKMENIENLPPKRKRKKEKIPRPILTCDKCQKKFRSEIVYNQHKNRHEGIKNFCCDRCGKGFYFQYEITKHLEIHKETSDYDCKDCGKMFKGKINLVQHRRILHTSENSICDVCGKTFKNSVSLRLHMLCHSNERKFKCTYCENSFKRKSDLRTHTRIHTNERPFKCTKCTESFRQSNSLKIHLVREHLKVKNFSCDYCEKKFFTLKNVRQHMLIHTSYRVQCSICDKSFKLMKSLQRHVKVYHENQRNFECEICKKRFREGYALKAHMRVHSMEKFECPKCQKLFKLAANLRTHLEKRHSETQVYICNYCKNEYDTIEEIQKHDCVVVFGEHSNSSD